MGHLHDVHVWMRGGHNYLCACSGWVPARNVFESTTSVGVRCARAPHGWSDAWHAQSKRSVMSGGAHRAQVRGDGEARSAMKGPYSLLQMTQRPPSFLEG
eukprot:2202534-Alexandrium_andersonii.AAC.1